MVRASVAWIVAALMIAMPSGAWAQTAPALTALDDCVLKRFVGIGLACERGNDLLEVFDAQGASLGFTHRHPDPVPEGAGGGDPPAATSQRDPSCVAGNPGDYYAIVIYARASDDTDDYAIKAPQVRDMVKAANFKVDEAAQVWGMHADLKVLCDASNQIIVRNEVLPTSRNSDDFGSISGDLRNRGYTDPKVKHWVYYDDGVGAGYAGQGNFYGDDRLLITNNNNGNAAAMFALDYGYLGDFGAYVMLHELGHNLGAVQYTAPHSTGAAHCTDGWDTMCYNDGGSKGNQYTTSICPVRIWDCNQDDYFNVNPGPTNYLATHWNIGNPLNRFIVIDGIILGPVTCPTRGTTDLALSCTMQADSAAAGGVRFEVAWGDGATTAIPSTGYVPNASPQSASHAYAAAGTYTITITTWDDRTPARTSSTTRSIEVRTKWAPEIDLVTCPPRVTRNTVGTCQVRAFDTDGDNIRYTVEWGDGSSVNIPTNGYVAQNVVQSASHSWAQDGVYTVRVSAVDDSKGAGLAATPVTRTVEVRDAWPPAITTFSCAATPYWSRTVTCAIASSDGDSLTLQHQFTWGDGTLTVSSPVAPGGQQSLTHTYLVDGVFTLSAVAIDPDGLQSDARTYVVDARLPIVNIIDPAPGTAYMGCDVRAESPTITVGPATDMIDVPPIEVQALPAFARIGCVTLYAWDQDSGVGRLEVYAPGACPGYDWWVFTNPSTWTTFEYPICETGAGYLSVTAWDRQWNGASDYETVTTATSECGPVYALDVIGVVFELIERIIGKLPPIDPVDPGAVPPWIDLDPAEIGCKPVDPKLPPIIDPGIVPIIIGP